jgi:hypothetical protein
MDMSYKTAYRRWHMDEGDFSPPSAGVLVVLLVLHVLLSE